LGANHVTKGGDRDKDPDTTTMVEQKHPDPVYVVSYMTQSSRVESSGVGPDCGHVAAAVSSANASWVTLATPF